MALIERQKGRRYNQSPGGYTRLFGDIELGQLLSKTHASVISGGNELENMLWERVNQISDLDNFITKEQQINNEKVYVARKNQIKQSTIIHSKHEPDFLVFEPIIHQCYIIEVKDGDQFDTKKAAGERNSLLSFKNDISSSIPYKTNIYLCGFNSQDKNEVIYGMKNTFQNDEILTGRDLCDILRIDYDDIVKKRQIDQIVNYEYFVTEVKRICLS